MRYQIPKTTLSRAALEAYRLTRGASAIPVCKVVQITAYPDGLELRATDLMMWRTETIRATPLDGTDDVTALVMAGSLRDIVRAQTGKVLSVEVAADAVTVDGVAVEMSPFPLEDLPSYPELPSAVSLELEWGPFARAIARTQPVISREDSRFTLCASLLRANQDGYTLVATDGHRLHECHVPPGHHRILASQSLADVETLIPRTVMDSLVRPGSHRALARDLRPVLHIGEDYVDAQITTHSGEGVIWRWKQVEGTFPDYERVLKPVTKMAGATLDRKMWDAAIAGLLPLCKGPSALRVVCTPAGTELAAGTAYESRRELPSRWGTELVLGLNPRYLRQLLAAGGENMRLYVKGERSGVQAVDDDGFRGVLMPVALDRQPEDLAQQVAARLAAE